MIDLLQRALSALTGAPADNSSLILELQTAVDSVRIDYDLPAQFAPGSLVRHHSKSIPYRILLTPREGLRVEETARRAYAYVSTGGDKSIWVREQAIMESEGRFEILTPSRPSQSRWPQLPE